MPTATTLQISLPHTQPYTKIGSVGPHRRCHKLMHFFVQICGKGCGIAKSIVVHMRVAVRCLCVAPARVLLWSLVVCWPQSAASEMLRAGILFSVSPAQPRLVSAIGACSWGHARKLSRASSSVASAQLFPGGSRSQRASAMADSHAALGSGGAWVIYTLSNFLRALLRNPALNGLGTCERSLSVI